MLMQVERNCIVFAFNQILFSVYWFLLKKYISKLLSSVVDWWCRLMGLYARFYCFGWVTHAVTATYYYCHCTAYRVIALKLMPFRKRLNDILSNAYDFWNPEIGKFSIKHSIYRTCAILTRGLYILNQLFEDPKRFFKEFFFQKILALCMVSIQERVMMEHVL